MFFFTINSDTVWTYLNWRQKHLDVGHYSDANNQAKVSKNILEINLIFYSQINQIKQSEMDECNEAAAEDYTTEEIIIRQLRSDENAIIFERANITDEQSIILSETAINKH